jgi:hypothetical protein
MTVIRKNGRIVKKIPWMGFRLEQADWDRVLLCVHILADANLYQQVFSSEKSPTLYRAIPALESLCSKWELKAKDSRYKIYHSALASGISKLAKYYAKLSDSTAYVLGLGMCGRVSLAAALLTHSTVLHPYYAFAYIDRMWDGEAEMERQHQEGILDAKNWQAEAVVIVKDTVS